MQLGILDQSIVHHSYSSTDALQETLETLQLAERLGYQRFWVSEHHNSPRVAGSTPPVLMAHLAAKSQTIRIGSGGIMLPNHSAYKVGEDFRMLETLYPGRIDLGMGRAPGGDQIAARLLNPSNTFQEDDYLQQLQHLGHFFTDSIGTEKGPIYAMPQAPGIPEQWILSSSGGSSSIAAKLGHGLAVARFINGFAHPSIVETYKNEFQPSAAFELPRVMLSIVALCGETPEKAESMRKYVDFMFLQMNRGDMHTATPYEEIMAYAFTQREQDILGKHQGRVVSGTPHEVKSQLTELAEKFEADELMLTNMACPKADRLKSFELIAEAFREA